MSCETCGGTPPTGPELVLSQQRLVMPGPLVLVEWQGEGPLTINTSSRRYLFTPDRRQLYMTAEDYAALAQHVDGVVIVQGVEATSSTSPVSV